MNSKWFKFGVLALVIGLLAVGAVAAYAQGPRGGYMGGQGNSLVATAAEVIGIDQAELVAELQSGQTIADVAAAHDVVVEDIVNAFVAPRAEWLASAVESGRLSQEQADLMLANMRAHVTLRLSEPFEPYGGGFMGRHGMGGGMHHGMGPGMGFNYDDDFWYNCPFGNGV